MASIIIDEIVPTKWRLRLRDPEGKTREVEVRAGTPVQLDVEADTDRKHEKPKDAAKEGREKPRVDTANKSRATEKSRADAGDKARKADKPRPDAARVADKARAAERPRPDAVDKPRPADKAGTNKSSTTRKNETIAKAEPTTKVIEEKPAPPAIRRRKPEPGPGPGNLVWAPTEDDGVPGIRAPFERGVFKILHAGGDAHGLFYEWNSGKYQTLQCGPIDALKEAAARWTEDGRLQAPRSNLGAEAAKLACATNDEPVTPRADAPKADMPNANTPKTNEPKTEAPKARDTPPASPPREVPPTAGSIDPEKDKVLMQGFEASVQKMLAARKGAP